MTTLIITRGLQGSGKTTRAKAWVKEDPERRVRINRDDLRVMMHDGKHIHGAAFSGPGTETAVIAVRDAAIRTALKRGLDVVVDDMNLHQRGARDLRKWADLEGATFEVWDMTDVPLEVCLQRNNERSDKFPIPEEVIRDYWEKFIRGKEYPLPLPPESEIHVQAEPVPYQPKPDTEPVVLVDIDGTIALKGTRSPYDESKVHEDRPNRAVIAAVKALKAASYGLIFASGRTEACREATEEWLRLHLDVKHPTLFMRPIGDMRKDAAVKLEIFDREIRDQYNVLGVFDDRNQVVEMWRKLGLTCFQVAEGDF